MVSTSLCSAGIIREDAVKIRGQMNSNCDYIITQLGKFMKCEISKGLFEETKNLLDIKDPTKVVLASFLLDRWVACNIDNETLYIKHCKSHKKNVLYQIILSGDDSDGIYEFKLKGTRIKLSKIRDCLKIESTGNYELAQFKDKYNQIYSISRSLPDFKRRILSTGMVTEEEYNFFTSGNAKIKEQLPHILF